MSAYKQFLASDIIITPFEVSKGFSFQDNSVLTGSNVNIDRFLGKNITSTLFDTGSDPVTGFIEPQYQRLIYNSIKELYYSKYLSSSYGDPVNRAELVPGRDAEGDRLIGSASNQSYYNYEQTTLAYPKFFPTGSNEIIGVISIPVCLFGDYIKPNSFVFTAESGSLTDDGEGNILLNSTIVGNIFYSHGIITLIGDGVIPSYYGRAMYGTSPYGFALEDDIVNFITSSNVTCSFSSSYIINETQYKCTIRESEYNLTLNPSTISGSDGSPYGYVTESYFSPYITTVGLYDDQQNLLAIGKLAQPLPSSPTTDTTILISLDR